MLSQSLVLSLSIVELSSSLIVMSLSVVESANGDASTYEVDYSRAVGRAGEPGARRRPYADLGRTGKRGRIHGSAGWKHNSIRSYVANTYSVTFSYRF